MAKYNYRLMDGERVEGNTHREVVQFMGNFKLTPPRSLAGYRRESARRAWELYHLKIDPSTDATFIRTMLETGLLVVAEEIR